MSVISPKRKEDRLFVRKPFRHYRPRYSRAEARWGVLTLAALASIAAWTIWRGANADPALFAAATLAPANATARSGAAKRARANTSRGVFPVFPDALASKGWREGRIAQYDGKNLYEKINGRAGYFKNFGFKRLHYASLVHKTNGATSIDLELYDLAKPANAVGAYAGELGEAKPHAAEHGLWHRARNALLMTIGRYYLRAIGSAENATITAQLDRLRELFAAKLEGAPLPWGYGFFIAELGVPLAKINYDAKNAFSFEFASDVYSATLSDKQTQLFIIALANAGDALAIARKFVAGFASYGKTTATRDGVTWVKDRYIGALSSAFAAGRFVVGVRGAPTLERAVAAMTRVRKAAEQMPRVLEKRARPAEASGDKNGSRGTSNGSGSGSGTNKAKGDEAGPAAEPVKET